MTFASAGEAERRIAGVAAAARIVRELAEAGFAETWLVLQTGEVLGSPALADIARLAGRSNVRVAPPERIGELESAALGPVVRLTGDRLVPARSIPHLLAGNQGALDSAGIRLDDRAAADAILKQTGKAGDGPVSRWLNRPISRRLSALVLRVPGIRPIHATAGTALLALLMFAALVAGGEQGLVAGALLYQAASIFDGVDGEVARATFRSSRAGAVLDSVIDVTTNLLLIIGLTINLGSSGHAQALALAVWGFVLFVIGLAVIALRSARSTAPFSLDMVKHHYRGRFSSRVVRWLISAATIVSSRDFFALLFALLILIGLPMAVLYLFAGAATVWILFVLKSVRISSIFGLASPAA
ncbi:MAG TPA: CDP-alcohol phosphatidyltransferase family protein [Allosphingosinicella sp.]|nr:CDP-alcohol phosphatidyltransferase family protein [Allosphingosinicella sp.]